MKRFLKGLALVVGAALPAGTIDLGSCGEAIAVRARRR